MEVRTGVLPNIETGKSTPSYVRSWNPTSRSDPQTLRITAPHKPPRRLTSDSPPQVLRCEDIAKDCTRTHM